MKSKLLKAITALENAGFRVDRAVEEDSRDAGFIVSGTEGFSRLLTLNEKTGAIVIRCTPGKD